MNRLNGKHLFKSTLVFAFLSLFFAVAIGAMGAHVLKNLLEPAKLSSLETGVRYQFYHSLALLIIPLLTQYVSQKKLLVASWLFRAGICLFSGSIYLLSTIELTQIGWFKWFGPITPIGGLFFLSGWLFLLFAVLSNPKD
ncbi:MAG: DUF423 domain-containing protein [Flavobacteriales bacterium]|nr:DUF423 domain-containing protein [Flavobacteriales bacterium]